MAEPEGIAAFPVVISNGSGPLGGVLTATPPKSSAADIAYTPISGADAGKEINLPGGQKFGELTLKLIYDPTQGETLRAALGEVDDFTIAYPDLAETTFSGYINEIGEEELTDTGLMTTTVKIKLASEPIFNPTPS